MTSEPQVSLSIAFIARDEERYIEGALTSIAGLDGEVVVLLDDRTSDRTAEICRSHGATVYIEPWRGFPAQRNRALDLCRGTWVFFIDGDERLTGELRAEIQAVVSITREQENKKQRTKNKQDQHGVQSVMITRSPGQEQSPTGYWIPRHNLFFGKALRGGGWYPDHQLRLLRREQARYDETRLVHELVQLNGEAGYLNGHLLHLNIDRLDELWRKQTSYAIQEAQTLFRKGQRARFRNFIGAPLREFSRRFLALGGYRDGLLGLFLCGVMAYFEIVKYMHLKGLEKL